MENKEANENTIVFDIDKMKRFIEKDTFLTFVSKDLMSRGHAEEHALELVFNSYVLEDSIMEADYSAL